jgi:hypothetical protein
MLFESPFELIINLGWRAQIIAFFPRNKKEWKPRMWGGSHVPVQPETYLCKLSLKHHEKTNVGGTKPILVGSFFFFDNWQVKVFVSQLFYLSLTQGIKWSNFDFLWDSPTINLFVSAIPCLSISSIIFL